MKHGFFIPQILLVVVLVLVLENIRLTNPGVAP